MKLSTATNKTPEENILWKNAPWHWLYKSVLEGWSAILPKDIHSCSFSISNKRCTTCFFLHRVLKSHFLHLLCQNKPWERNQSWSRAKPVNVIQQEDSNRLLFCLCCLSVIRSFSSVLCSQHSLPFAFCPWRQLWIQILGSLMTGNICYCLLPNKSMCSVNVS